MKLKAFSTLFLVAVSVLFPHLSYAKSTEDKIKGTIDSVADKLKSGVDELGDDLAKIQDYLDHYQWKGIIQDNATSGVATLSNLNLNNHGKAVVVLPGERVSGVTNAHLDASQCNALSIYRVVLGLKGVGPQTTICNCLGAAAGDTVEKITLIAPSKPGFYEIRFRPVEALLESTALDAWKDAMGKEPDASTTIGIIYVKQG